MAPKRDATTPNKPEDLEALGKRLDDLTAVVQAPFYKDRRFWAGLLVIPILAVMSWGAEWIAKVPYGFRIIHTALGTENALVAALNEEGNTFRSGIEDKSKKIMSSGSLVEPVVNATISKKFSVLHTDMLRVGLLYPNRVEFGPCPSSHDDVVPQSNVVFGNGNECQFFAEAVVNNASFVFSTRDARKVDIDLGVMVHEIVVRPEGSLSILEVTKTFPIDAAIRVDIDEQPLTYVRQGSTHSYRIGNDILDLIHLRSADVTMTDKELYKSFPMHTVSVSIANEYIEKYAIIVAIIVRENGEP